MDREPQPDAALTETVAGAIAARLAASKGLIVAGICGAQGSGKSTLAAALERRFCEAGIATAALSLDDFYLTRTERQALSRDVHPLFVTRGPPGTHDIALGLEVLAALERGEPAPLPHFDKGRDDRSAIESWLAAPANTRLLVFEGWCLGATSEEPQALVAPINAFERDEDPQGIWRRHANAALAGDYQRLFNRLDLLVFLAAPNFEVVDRWRGEQEASLFHQEPTAPHAMDRAAVARFIQHYERLTRHMLAEMPGRTDVTAWLDQDRHITRMVIRPDRS